MSNYTKSTNFATKDNLSPGNPLKIVKGTEIDTEFNNIQTAVATKTDNASANITGGSITGITDLAVADGGTGASTATAALNNLLPSQTSNANKYLQTDGTNATWDAVSLSTSDITGTLPVANGGTGVTSSTGTGNVVLSNSPTLVTPALGTPASATLTNATGLPISTGVSGLGTGVATFLGTPSSANLASAVSDETGSGALVFANSPTLVTPALGTPSSGTLTNATGLPISTGVSGLGTGVATFLATPSSANLISAVTDETGTGSLVFATSPTLVTPALGTPSALVGTNITGTASGLTAGNVTTNANLTGAVTSVGNATSLGSFSSSNLAGALTDETGSGSAVFATSPTLVTPILGTPTSATLTNATGLPISTGVSGLGTGVATALAVNVGSSGAPLVNGGVLGTPSSGTATNLTGLPLSTGVTGTLPVANGGTGTATPSIVAGTNVTVTGTWPNQTIAASGGGGSGTVTSVAATVPSLFSITGSPITTSGTLAMTYSGTALPVANGGTGQTSYTDGQLLIGNTTGNTLTKATLTAGTGVTITNGNGSISIAASGGSYDGFKNRIINGAMVIDQRNAGASVTPTDGLYTLDRWQFGVSQASKLTVQQSSTAPTGFSNSLLVTSSSTYSIGSGDYFYFRQYIEGFNFADFMFGTANAQTLTLSFWVRSSLTGTFGGSLINSAGNRSYPFTYTINSANTFEQKTVTVTGDTSGTWVGATNGAGISVNFGLGVGATYSGTAGAWAGSLYLGATGATSVVGTSGATLYITGVQLEKGSTATSFDVRSYTTELQLCQRYYYKIIALSGTSGVNILQASFYQSSSGYAAVVLPVAMRANPTGSYSAVADFYVGSNGSYNVLTSITANNGYASSNLIEFYWSTGSGTIGFSGFIRINNTSGWLAYSAEL